MGESLDLAAEREARAAERREVEDQMLFPDEVDTPENQTVVDRYRRYRVVGEMGRAAWDLSRGLPSSYRRIYQFPGGFAAGARRRALRRARARERLIEEGKAAGAMPGTHLAICLRGVPSSVAAAVAASMRRGSVMAAVGLLPHENRRGVLHLAIQRHGLLEDTEVVRSRDAMVLHVGFRSLKGRPMFSQQGPLEGGGQLKYLFVRFLLDGAGTVASLYAPACPPGAPAVLLRAEDLRMVAAGAASDVDADRVILRRVVLTGMPLRIHKRVAVVRNLFNFDSDGEALAGVRLYSKMGRKGQLVGSLGTHGLVKVVFGEQLTHDDTVCLAFFRRVFPNQPDSDV